MALCEPPTTLTLIVGHRLLLYAAYLRKMENRTVKITLMRSDVAKGK